MQRAGRISPLWERAVSPEHLVLAVADVEHLPLASGGDPGGDHDPIEHTCEVESRTWR
jgi:hypothetical protein